MADFECHITLSTEHREIGQRLAEERGWKTSEIARDPVLGEETYFYLTKHAKDYDRLFVEMKEMSKALKLELVAIFREKIEEILYDSRKAFLR